MTFSNSFLPFQFPYPSIFATCHPFPEIFTSFPFPPNRANSLFYPSVRSSSPTYYTSTFISNSADSKWRGIMWYPSFGLMCMCPPIPLSAPMVSRYNFRTDFKFCTVIWYHKMQIMFEFQCDQIIGSKVVTVWRLKICDFSWYRRNSRKGGPRIECLWYGRI